MAEEFWIDPHDVAVSGFVIRVKTNLSATCPPSTLAFPAFREAERIPKSSRRLAIAALLGAEASGPELGASASAVT